MLEKLQKFYAVNLLYELQLQKFYGKLGMQLAQGVLVKNFEKLKTKR